MKVLKESFRFGVTTLFYSISSLETEIIVTGDVFDNNGGILVIDRLDSYGNSSSIGKEFISYSGSYDGVLRGVKRGLYGTTATAHEAGALIEAVPLIKEEVYKLYLDISFGP